MNSPIINNDENEFDVLARVLPIVVAIGPACYPFIPKHQMTFLDIHYLFHHPLQYTIIGMWSGSHPPLP
jgi:hypothetical protein